MPLPISRCAGAAARRRLEAPATDDGGVAKYEAHAAAVDAAADDAPDGGGAVTTSGKNSPHWITISSKAGKYGRCINAEGLKLLPDVGPAAMNDA